MVHYYQKLIKQNSAKHNKEFYSFKKKFKKIGSIKKSLSLITRF